VGEYHISPLGQTLGDGRMFPNLRRAVSVYLESMM
jgi:hypothetical protein